MTGPEWSAELELWLPLWPFERFLSLSIIGLGTLVLTRSRSAVKEKPLAAPLADWPSLLLFGLLVLPAGWRYTCADSGD